MFTNHRNRRAGILGILVVIALALAACGGNDDDASSDSDDATGGDDAVAGDLVSAAREEGSVVFYSAYNAELSQALADEFSATYDIDVEVVRQASADLNARFAAEADAGAVVADVLWQPDSVFADAATDNGWLATLTAEEIEGLDRVPAEDVTDTYIPVLLQPWGIAYNTNLVSGDQVPETWEDLSTGEALEGGLLVANPANSVSTSAVYNFWLDAFGEEYFTGLKDTQGFSIGDSVSNAIQQVGAGEAGAFVPAPLSTVSAARAAGAPVDIVIPDDTTGFAMLASVTADAEHPNAARLFVSFLLSDAGQAIAVSDIGIPVIDGVEAAVTRPSGYVPSDNAATAERIDELTDLLGA